MDSPQSLTIKEPDSRLLEAIAWIREAGWLGSERSLAEELGLNPTVFYKVRNGLQSFPKEGLFGLEALLGLNPAYVREGRSPRFHFARTVTKGTMYDRARIAALVQGRSAEDVRSAMGLSEAKWKLLRNGSESQLAGLPQALSRTFPTLPVSWLLMGFGKPDEAEQTPAHPPATPSGSLEAQILHLPYVDNKAKASFVTGFLQGRTADQLPLRPYLSRADQRTPPDAMLIEVDGDSMAPTLQPRDVLLIAPVPASEWKYESGGVYVVVYGEDHLVVKRLQRNRLATEGYLTLESDNPTGGHIELPASEINGLFKVLAVTRNL